MASQSICIIFLLDYLRRSGLWQAWPARCVYPALNAANALRMTNRIKHIRWAAKRIAVLLVSSLLVFILLNLLFPLRVKIDYSVIVTDKQGELIHAFLSADQQWRMKTELSEISPLLRKTIVAKEDKYFYYHPGVNLLSLVRAMANNILQGRRTSGASTITMQVARALEPRKRTYLNKLVDMFRALQLELTFSKDQILQMYLNLVPYGGNIEGVKAASFLYFKKPPDHLSLAEITALSIIPNRPASLIMGKNNALIVEQRNKWLRRFARDKVFSPLEIQDALQEPLMASRGKVPTLVPQLAYKLKKSGSEIIKTNIVLNTQLKVEKLVQDYTRALQLKNIRNAAVVVLDNLTQEVIAYVGSSNFNDSSDGGQVNGAASVRQPGSTLKPLLYGLCIDAGLLTPKMVITDVGVNYAGYAPENYDKKFNGYVTMEYALEHSLNIPAVKSLKALGTERLIEKLASCDFLQIKKDQRKLGLSMILGGCGATLEELTGMYSIFAHAGRYLAPKYMQTDHSAGEAASTENGQVILSPAAAYMVCEILSKVNRPDFPLNWESTVHMPKIAWKTGTSYGRRDGWSIGFNRHFTVGVWTGNFSGQGIPELSGANVATPLLFRIFNTIDYDQDEDWFTQPPDCDIRQVCSQTGWLPSGQCTDLVTDYFIPLVSPAKICDENRLVLVSQDEKTSYCPICAPASGYKKKWFRYVSADMQRYFDQHKIAYEKIPPHNPSCEMLFKASGPEITSPSNGSEYLINTKDPEPLELACNTSQDVNRVYWYINDKFYKAANVKTKQFFIPQEGPIKISCTDDQGRNKDIRIKVKFVSL
jgi:penicillin-binding protein 1C